MHGPQDDVIPLHEPFETALRGFNRQQVLAHIESLEGHIAMVAADRESALTQLAQLSRSLDHLREESQLLTHLRREAEQANERVELMAQSPIVGASIRIQRMVRLAEEEAAELRARAAKDAEELRARAEQEAAELRARAAKDAEEIRARTDQEVTARRKRAVSDAETLLRDMTQRCSQLEADCEQRRKAAEQATEEAIARRESEAGDRIRSRDQRGLAGLHLVFKIVGPQLAQRVSAVERLESELSESRTRTGHDVRALETLRDKITAQLAATRQVLADALEEVQQTTADEQAAAHPMPIQRAGRPAAANGSDSATVQRVNSRSGERRSSPATSA
jgi:cell division septum initiation protein DivIVA